MNADKKELPNMEEKYRPYARGRLVEGNPTLVDEHPIHLESGALVYDLNRKKPQIEVILSGLPEHDMEPFFAIGSDYKEDTDRLYETLVATDHIGIWPTEEVGRVGEFVDNLYIYLASNNLLKEIVTPGQQVRVVIATHSRWSLEPVDGKASKFYTPKSNWAIEIIPASSLAYPKPE